MSWSAPWKRQHWLRLHCILNQPLLLGGVGLTNLGIALHCFANALLFICFLWQHGIDVFSDCASISDNSQGLDSYEESKLNTFSTWNGQASPHLQVSSDSRYLFTSSSDFSISPDGLKIECKKYMTVKLLVHARVKQHIHVYPDKRTQTLTFLL